MDYALIKEHVNMRRLLKSYGVELSTQGRCSCPIHGGDNKTAFSVSNDLQTWHCHTKCDIGGDIFTFVEMKEKLSNPAAKLFVMERFALQDEPEKKQTPVEKPTVVGKKTYIYCDKDGNELYKVNRVDYSNGKKDCFQECNGKPTLPPEVRTLYNYDKIYGSEDFICLCEGEKTADSLTKLGFTATTNPLGSKSWDAKYAELLRDKKVIIMPDADEHGEKWRDAVLSSLEGVCLQAQIVNVPAKFIKSHPEFTGHDFADMVQVGGDIRSCEWLTEQIETTKVLDRGYDRSILGLPIDGYRELVRKAKAGIRTDVFNLNQWLPSLDLIVNKGDLVVLMAGTGVGKSRILNCIPYFIRHVNYAMFDLELSYETLCERYTAMVNGISVRAVKQFMIDGRTLKEPNLDNVFIQKISKLTVDKMRDRLDLLEQHTQKKIEVVGVDYIGLMSGVGSQYEITTRNVEDFKAFLSDTGRVGILPTQITRPENKNSGVYECPNPYAAKNSGSVENSAQELLAIWRPTDDARQLKCRVYKYTHGEYPQQDIDLIANDLVITEARR